MSIYKQITSENVTTSEVEVYQSQSIMMNFTDGVPDSLEVLPFVNSTADYTSLNATVKKYNDYYHSLKHNFYLSGSNYSISESRYNAPYFKKGPEYNSSNPQYFHKFHKSSSLNNLLFTVPQHYYGDYIKPGSFKLNTDTITIIDDKHGNLYSTNATVSSSIGHLSSSDNYVGNIFYRAGVAVLTTGAEIHNGSTKYFNHLLSSAAGNNVSCSFLSSKDIYVTEYSLTIEPNEFNKTNNPTAREGISGSEAGVIHSDFTASNWSPYFNTVGFYDDNNALVAKARYPQNIKTRRDIPITLKIKLDF